MDEQFSTGAAARESGTADYSVPCDFRQPSFQPVTYREIDVGTSPALAALRGIVRRTPDTRELHRASAEISAQYIQQLLGRIEWPQVMESGHSTGREDGFDISPQLYSQT